MVRMEAVPRHDPVGAQTIAAVDGVSFEVPQGQFMVIARPSGSGQSTSLLEQRHAGVSDCRFIVLSQLYQQNQKTSASSA
ncbi:MAG: hypothetical protein ABI268_03780 [Rhodanobacter sp.]